MLFYQLKYQASERLHDKFTNFVSKNKAAQIQQSGRFALAPFSLLYEKCWPFREMPIHIKVLAFTVLWLLSVFVLPSLQLPCLQTLSLYVKPFYC